MNRKAEEIAGKVLVEILIFVIIFFVALQIGSKVWQLYISKPQEVTASSMYLLQKHIKYFDGTPDTFALQVHKKHTIEGFDADSGNKPGSCEGSCICMCNGECCPDNECSKVIKCVEAFDSKGESVGLSYPFLVTSTEPKNYLLTESDDKLVIE